MLEKNGAKIVHTDEMGLRQLAYPINRRTTGIYYSIEFNAPVSDVIGQMELSMRRDERIMRFLTCALDKYGIKYNQDKRDGKIGKAKKKVSKSAQAAQTTNKPSPAPAKKESTPAPVKKEAAPAAVKKEAAPAAVKKESTPTPPPPAATAKSEEE